MSKSMKIGYIYALMTMLAWSIQMVISRYAGNALEANPFVFVTTGLFVGAFVLVLIAGQGAKAVASMRSGHTWLYSIFQLALNIGTMVSMLYVTSTQSMFLQKINILVALFIGWAFFDNRKVSKHDMLGSLIVASGVVLMFSTIPSDKIVMAVISILFIAFCHVMRTNIAERHEIAKNATTFNDQCRVTGYVLLSTSLTFLSLGMIIGLLKSMGNDIPLDIFPAMDNFITSQQLVLATVLGLFIIPVGMFSYFYASKNLKSENMVIITAYLPLFTFAVESIAAKFGFVELRSLILQDYISALLIMGGATYIALKRNGTKKVKKKLKPREKDDLLIVRKTIDNTLEFFKDDLAKASKALGYAPSTIERILTSEKPVSQTMSHNIIKNHAKSVTGLDQLTGTYNQSSFHSILKALKDVEKALVLFIDLDKFKPVNDTYGHDVGDCLLQGVAERLIAEYSHPHIIARLGGDEFTAIIYNADKGDEEKIIEKMKQLITDPFSVEGVKEDISVGCSIGSAHYPSEGHNGLELKQIADDRMYADKKATGAGR